MKVAGSIPPNGGCENPFFSVVDVLFVSRRRRRFSDANFTDGRHFLDFLWPFFSQSLSSTSLFACQSLVLIIIRHLQKKKI
jgi:hypothetical protein